jgi:hypothetical protein
MRYLLERLRERSTWLGLTALLTALGAGIDPACLDQIATAGAATAGLILTLMPDPPAR